MSNREEDVLLGWWSILKGGWGYRYLWEAMFNCIVFSITSAGKDLIWWNLFPFFLLSFSPFASHLPPLTCSWPVVGARRTNTPWRQLRRCWSPCRSPYRRCLWCLLLFFFFFFKKKKSLFSWKKHGSSNSLAIWPELSLFFFPCCFLFVCFLTLIILTIAHHKYLINNHTTLNPAVSCRLDHTVPPLRLF